MSIEFGPSPEEMGLRPEDEQPIAKSNPDATPKNQSHEKREFIRAGNKEMRVGDNVCVVRSNNKIEQDWKLKSLGDKFTVVEKIDIGTGEVLRKVIPLGEFVRLQASTEQGTLTSSETTERPDDLYPALEEGYGKKPQRINFNTPEGKAYLAKYASKMGIDTSKADWESDWNKKIRQISGG